MKKFDLSKIMTQAWVFFKSHNKELSFGKCLRKSWNRAKTILKLAEERAARIKKAIAEKNDDSIFKDGMEITMDGMTRTLTRWTKGNFDRVYINGGSRKGDGFVDLKNRTMNLRGELTYQIKIAEAILAMDI